MKDQGEDYHFAGDSGAEDYDSESDDDHEKLFIGIVEPPPPGQLWQQPHSKEINTSEAAASNASADERDLQLAKLQRKLRQKEFELRAKDREWQQRDQKQREFFIQQHASLLKEKEAEHKLALASSQAKLDEVTAQLASLLAKSEPKGDQNGTVHLLREKSRRKTAQMNQEVAGLEDSINTLLLQK